jgi:iron complex outermembrane receptor protein
LLLTGSFHFAPHPIFAADEEARSTQETTQEKKSRGEHKLGTMTVTAQKQEENVQEVPVSISVFNELDIEDRKIESIRDMADFAPNLMIHQHGASGRSAPTMR